MIEHLKIQMDALEVEVGITEQGGWFISKLRWLGKAVCEKETELYAAGWEVTLNGVRHTPHLEDVAAEEAIREEASGGIHIQLPHRLPKADCRLIWHLYLTITSLEQWVEIHNESKETLEIKNLNFGQLKLDPGFMYGLQTYASNGFDGTDAQEREFTADNPAIFLENKSAGINLAALNLGPGHLRRIKTGAYLSVGYGNGTMPFIWMLKPNERFESDRAAFVFYEADRTEAVYRFIQERIRKGSVRQRLTYCSWEPFGRAIDEQKLTAQMDRAAELGFELFVIDDGWQDYAGDWRHDAQKFPNGIEVLRDRASSKGMTLGLWLSLATVNTKSLAYREYEDCLVRDAEGRLRLTHVFEGSLALACLCTRFADYITERVCELVDRLKLGYLKLDLPVVYDVYNQPAIHCHCGNHGHEPGWDYSLKTYRALTGIVKSIKARHPEVTIDLTFELWGAWHVIDYALIANADVCWISNIRDNANDGGYGPAQARHLAAERSALMPTGHLAVGNLRCSGPYPEESVASSFASYPVLLGDLEALSQDDTQRLSKLLKWYATLRESTALDEHYAVLLPRGVPAPSQYEWSGFLRCSAEVEGLIGLFRNLSSQEQTELAIALPPHVDDEAKFVLSNFSTGLQMKAMGKELRNGLRANAEAMHGWELFSIRKCENE